MSSVTISGVTYKLDLDASSKKNKKNPEEEFSDTVKKVRTNPLEPKNFEEDLLEYGTEKVSATVKEP